MDGTIDHVMLRVESLGDSIDWYRTHFGYEERDRYDGDGFTIVYLAQPDQPEQAAMLELTHNEGESPHIGDAWGHIALRVPEGELGEAYDTLIDAGVEDYRDPASCGGNYAFVRDPDGHEVELVQREVDDSWRLDHTMIRVEDVDRALGYWVRKFEYEPVGRWEADTFANYFVRPPSAGPAAMALELTYNYDGRSYEHGDAWGHLCVRVDELQAAWERLRTREAPAYRDPASCDDRYAFTKTPDGHEVELLSREPDAESLFPF